MLQQSRPKVVEIIPDEIKAVFEIADIEKVFEHLEKFFHISKGWRMEYKNVLKKASRENEAREIFALFLRNNLDPQLRPITKREDSIVFSIMRYVVKDRIEIKRRESSAGINYYRNKK